MRNQYIEQFIAHLKENPDAPAPPGMDAEEAEFIRKLVKTSNQPAAYIKPLIWRHVLEAAQKENKMIVSHPIQSKSTISFVWITAAAVIMLLAAAFIIAMNFTPNEAPSAAPLQQQSEEATSVPPTVPPSPTILPAQIVPATEVPPMFITATPIPFDSGSNYSYPPVGFVPVVTVFVPISVGEVITADMLTIVYWQADRRPSGSFEQIEDVIGQFASTDLIRFMPVFEEQISLEAATATPVPTLTTTPTPTLNLTLRAVTQTQIPTVTFTPTPAN